MFDWERIIDYGKRLSVPKKTTLYHQGETGRGFYYLYEGEIKITTLREDGYERIIDYVAAGGLLGEQGISGSSYVTTAQAAVDSTLYYYTDESFHQICMDYPDAAQALSYSLISKIRLLVERKSIQEAPIEALLAHHLLSLHEKRGSCTLHLNQSAISNYVGKSRVAVWRVLKTWKKEQIVSVHDRVIRLKDLPRLKEKLYQ
nr:Crp/Fnr family transcriptional regulator [Bacillus piscicola]